MRLSPSFPKRAAELCRAIAPLDLAGRAVYVVPFSTVAARFPRLGNGCCRGWTSPVLDLTLRPLVKWQGRGFACVIRDDQLHNEHEAFDVVLHELAHELACIAPLATMKPKEINATPFASAIKLEALPVAIESTLTQPWLGHCERFIRAALHVVHRAAAVGHRTTPQGVSAGGEGYGLSAGQRYALALGAEPRDSEGQAVRTILDSQAPAAFVRLWQRDTERVAA